MENNHQYAELREKIIAGVNLAFQRLVEKAKITDDYLVFSEKGKVVHVKARSIK
jgi:hypothetical protein